MLKSGRSFIVGVLLFLCLSCAVSAYAEVVVFPDPGLDAAVRAAISKPTGDILDTDLVGVGFTSLDASWRDIGDLTGLEHCTDLTNLDLNSNLGISDLSALADLTNLTWLNLNQNMISDLGVLAGLTNLTTLWLDNNQISDLSALAGLTNLTNLALGYNQISDLSALAGLTNLTGLYLERNQISDLSALAGLTNLTGLGLAGSQISDLSALAGLVNLTWLNLVGNQISDLSALAGLTNLTTLGLDDNQVSSLSALAGLTNLTELYLAYNQISSLSALAGLTNLTYLSLGYNQISDIMPLVINAGLGPGDMAYLTDNPLSQQALCEQIPELLGREVSVMYDGECGDPSRCYTFEALEAEGSAFAAAQGAGLGLPTNYATWDIERWPAVPYGDGIPDLWELRLLGDAYCNDHHWLHELVASVYEANLAMLLSEMPEAASPHWAAAAMGLSAEMRAAICAIYGLDPNHYQVCRVGKTTEEPFSAEGDCDGDRISNLDEYEYVVSAGGDIEAFMMEAGENNPFWNGNPAVPAAGLIGLALLAISVGLGATRLLAGASFRKHS